MAFRQDGMRQLATTLLLSARSHVTSAFGASPAAGFVRQKLFAPHHGSPAGSLVSAPHLSPTSGALRGISSSAPAARPPGATVRASMENAETMMMSEEEIRALGAKKRPPGEHPGGDLHQQGKLTGWLKPELKALYPLFAMVSLGLGLAVWNMSRELYKDPNVLVSKTRRQQELFEIDHPETIRKESDRYLNDNLLRKLAHKGSVKARAQTQ